MRESGPSVGGGGLQKTDSFAEAQPLEPPSRGAAAPAPVNLHRSLSPSTLSDLGDEYAEDATEDVAQDATEDVAEDADDAESSAALAVPVGIRGQQATEAAAKAAVTKGRPGRAAAPAATAAPASAVPVPGDGSAPPLYGKDEQSSGAGGAPAEAPAAAIDFFNGREPPQVIARPKPVDTAKLIRDLAFLAGLQMGQGAYDEAWITIGMLRSHDPAKARELSAILEDLERQKREAGEKKADVPAQEAAEPQAGASAPDDGQVDKYSALPADGAPLARPGAAPPEPSPEAVPAPKSAPAPDAEAEPPPATVDAGAEAIGESAADAAIVVPDPPPPVEVTGGADALQPMVAPGAYSTPVPAAVPAPGIADAPTVEKKSPDAFPPTLWENTVGADEGARWRFPSRPVPPPAQPQQPAGRRRLFTTDPYLRGD